MGSGKAIKYGKPFIDLIKKYVDENDIERPMDMVIKSVVNKSGLKVYIIQNIDRKVGLKEMAKSKSITWRMIADYRRKQMSKVQPTKAHRLNYKRQK